jgi:sodium-dependent dicarboxylate transporter 2/3/5
VEHERPGHLLALTGKIVALFAFVAILLAPRPTGMTPEAHRLAAVTAVMVALWLTDAVPMAATALIPLAAYPLLGIVPAKVVSTKYLDENVFLYLGGFVIALGIEKWGLHRRVALHIVRFIGPGSRRIVLGFMVATGFLSMWISNTAATLLMLPIGLAMLSALGESLVGDSSNDSSPLADSGALRRMGSALMLGIAYSASIGGLATPVGTPTNLVALGVWNDHPDLVDKYGSISIGDWMGAFVPLGAVMLLATWLVLTRGVPALPGVERLGREFFTTRLRGLGAPSRAEHTLMVIFVLTALLWVFRLPLSFGDNFTIPGWGPPLQDFLIQRLGADSVFAKDGAVHDSTVALLMAVVMFFLPAGRDERGRRQPLMDWETVQRGVPWGVLLLFGGGLAMADALTSTGLSEWVGSRLVKQSRDLSPVMLVLCLCLFVSYLTELTSNVATVSALAPVLIDAATGLKMDPRLLLIPATISASFGFMLPVGTPPNAIAFGTGKVKLPDMLRHGFWLDLIGAVLTTIATFTLLCPLLGIEW